MEIFKDKLGCETTDINCIDIEETLTPLIDLYNDLGKKRHSTPNIGGVDSFEIAILKQQQKDLLSEMNRITALADYDAAYAGRPKITWPRVCADGWQCALYIVTPPVKLYPDHRRLD